MERTSPRSLTHPARSSLLAPRPSRLAPRGFTLVELLVVITIIAILASLLVVAAMAAMNRARFARIKTEIDQIMGGIETYKNEISGGDYPPNAMISGSMKSLSSPTASAATLSAQVQNDMVRHFKKVAPRMRGATENALVLGLAGGNLSSSGATVGNGSQGTGTVLIGGLSPSEALVFWLNGFSSDPKAPLTGAGGPVYVKQTSADNNGGAEGRKPVFEFAVTRLGPRDDNGNFTGRFIELPGPNNTTYRLNLWQYYPSGSSEPLVYFDTSRPVIDVEPLYGPHVHAIKQTSDNTSAANEIRFVNDGKFQILHCGLDDRWGDFDSMSIVGKTPGSLQAQMLLSPKGPFTLDLADTITNFTTGTLEDAQP